MAFDVGSSDEEIRRRAIAEVDAISATPEFERAPVMRRLLSFLVHTTLDGRGDELKAYSVAVDGLGRDPDFDSQSDSYPRVQVGRLRKMLDAYYAQNPARNEARLSIKTGGYKVDFLPCADQDIGTIALPPATPPLPLRSLPPAGDPAPAWLRALTPARVVFMSIALILALSTLVLILSPSYRDAFLTPPAEVVERAPLLELGAIDIAGAPSQVAEGMRIRAILADGLHRSWIVRVRDTNGLRILPAAEAELSQADYSLSGQIVPSREPSRFRLFLALREARSGDQIWSYQFLLPAGDGGLLEPLRPAISTLIRPFGVIATRERAREAPKESAGYRCLLDYESYFRDRDPALRSRINACVRKTVALDPLNAQALAAASFLAFDPENETRDGPALAAEFARRAVAADPYSAEAHIADARAAFVAGNCRRGAESANRALMLNPHSPEIMGLMGFLLYQCDDPRAEMLMSRAQSLDPDIPTFYNIALILSLIDHGKTPEALIVADSMRPPGGGMTGQYALAQSIASAARGDMPAARQQWQNAVNTAGIKSGAADAVVARYILSPNMRKKVVDYLVKSTVIAPATR